MLSPIEKSAAILQKAKDDILLTLAGHETEMVSITIVSGLTQLINRLNYMTGNAPQVAAQQEFLPITSFFGEPISRAADIVASDLKATLTEREIFVNKVNSLQSVFIDKPAETIINNYTIAEDVQVLRGVAKRAGLPDYQTAIINIDFIERIKAGLTDKELKALEEEQINKQLAQPASLASETAGLHAIGETLPDNTQPIGEITENNPVTQVPRESEPNQTLSEHAELVATGGQSAKAKTGKAK